MDHRDTPLQTLHASVYLAMPSDRIFTKAHLGCKTGCFASRCNARKKKNNDGVKTVPKVLDNARLFSIETPSMRRPHLLQMTVLDDVKDVPVPISDHTKGPIMMLIAPP